MDGNAPTILIAGGGTGGHLTPALAIAAEIRRQRPDVEPVLVGAERGIEARILPGTAWRHHLLPSEPLYRGVDVWKNLRWMTGLPRLLRAIRRVLDAEQPAVVVGTGGYASGPVLWAASRRGIPIVLQEQNAYPGIATRRLARRATQIHLGFPEARRWLRPGGDTQVHVPGNPIRPPEAIDPAVARAALGIPADARVLFVVGGSQGSKRLNEAVGATLEAGLLQGVTLLWGTGPRWVDTWARWNAPPARLVRGYWDPIAEAYGAADLVLSRSGAMTVAELAAWGLPAIFVPFPAAAADHQTVNARAQVEAGAAVLLPESDLTPERLDREITQLMAESGRLQGMAERARTRARSDAVRYIVEAILRLVTA